MRTLTMQSASTVDRPRPAEAEKPKPRANHALTVMISELVRTSKTDVSGWGRLTVGVELERDGEQELVVPYLMSPARQAANKAALEVDHKIAAGWEHIGRVDAIPRSWVERLIELHGESQDRLYELDAIRRAEDTAEGKEPPSACALILRRACGEANAYLLDGARLPETGVLEFERLGLAIDDGDEAEALLAAKGYVGAAIWAKYGARTVDG